MADVEHDAPDSTLGALRDLIQSPGWKLLIEQAGTEWGPVGYGRQMQHALSTIPAGPDRAYEIAQVAERVEATARAVNALIAWPTEQINRLSASSKPVGRFAVMRRVAR